VFLVIAGFATHNFVRTLLREPGVIKVGRDRLVLPSGLCRGTPKEYPFDEVHHAFFLRRAVPWTRAGPVLVVEAGEAVFTYPRDWFASESDQRRVMEGINRHLGRLS
jgi:hypothetical protein